MVQPITFVDYLIVGKGLEGIYLAQALQCSGRGVLLLHPGEVPAGASHETTQPNTNLISLERKGMPLNSYRAICDRRRFQTRNVVICPGPSETLDFSIFSQDHRPALDPESGLPQVNGELESVNMPHLYYLGIHTNERAHEPGSQARYLHRVLEFRNHRIPMPYRVLPLSAEALARAVIQRISRADASSRTSNIGDLIFPQDHENACYYENIPLDTMPDCSIGKHAPFFTISLVGGEPSEPAANTKEVPELVVRFCGRCRDEFVVNHTRQWHWENLHEALCSFFSRSVPA